MTDKKRQKDFAEFVFEQMSEMPAVSYKSMFGGYGFYQHGLMFALVADENLYFKANDFLIDEFVALGLKPFVYQTKGKDMQLNYYAAPEIVFEEAQQMRLWSEKAYQCALRNFVAKNTKSARSKK
jgi:DNA transformation protein